MGTVRSLLRFANFRKGSRCLARFSGITIAGNYRDHSRDHDLGLLARTSKDLATFRPLISPSIS